MERANLSGETTLIKPLSFDEIQCKIEYYNIYGCDNAVLLHCHMVFKKSHSKAGNSFEK